MRLLSQPTPGGRATESPDGAVLLSASGPRARRVGARRRSGRGEGKGASVDPDGGSSTSSGGSGYSGSGGGRKLEHLADLPER
eukprot:5106257-Alexandrium_andersonii.AAC.1